jgi:rod shape determining protein RodA
MFAGMLAVGLLQNVHLRATAALPTRYARPVRHLVSR